MNYPYTLSLLAAIRKPYHIQCGRNYCIVNCWTFMKDAMYHGPERRTHQVAELLEDAAKFGAGLFWSDRGWIAMPPEDVSDRGVI